MEILGSLVLIGLGLLLAFAGRRYVWILIGATGFLLAFWLVGLILPGNSLAALLLALAAGLAAAFLLKGISRIILWIAGFILVGTAAVGIGASKNSTSLSDIKKAVVYGNILGSFAVEKYGLDGLLQIKKKDITKRVKLYEKMIRF